MMPIRALRMRNTAVAGPSQFSAESTGAQTVTTSATFQTLVSLTLNASDLTPNTDYLCIWSCESMHTSTVARAHVAPYIDSTQQSETISQSADTSYKVSNAGFFRLQVGATPTTTTLSLKGLNSQGGTTATFYDSRLVVIPLGADDHYAESRTRQTTTASGTTWTTATSLTFTPPTTGDYLCLASGLLDANFAGNPDDYAMRISDGTTANANLGQRFGNTDLLVPRIIGLPLISSSGSKTITLDYHQATGTANTVGITDARLVVIRLDRFADHQIARLVSDGSTTNTTYTTAHSQTFTPQARNYLTIACGMYEETGGIVTGPGCEFDDGGTVVSETINGINVTTNDACGTVFATARIAPYTATSRTQAVKIKAPSGQTAKAKRDFLIASLAL